MSAPDVVAASEKANTILDALALDNNINVNSSAGWYEVSVAGFNYVDDQCNSYFDHLFYLNREKDTVKGLLNAAGQTSSAILAVTKASNITLAVVSQAFGFGSSATELVAGTFLYQLPPATTLGFVTKLQTAFRAGVAAQARLGMIRNRSDSYHLIQQYLALCLPPSIEAEIVKQVSGTTAAPDSSSPPGSMAVLTGSSPPSSVPSVTDNRPPAGPVIPRLDVNRPPPRPPQPAPTVSDGVNSEESGVFVSDLEKIQAAFCLTPDGKFGGLIPKSPTRRSIDGYWDGLHDGKRAADAIGKNGGLSDKALVDLRHAISVGDCAHTHFANGYEVGAFGVPKSDTKGKIEGLQEALRDVVKSVSIPDTELGTFGPETRRAIDEYRKLVGRPQEAETAEIGQLDRKLVFCISARVTTCP